MQDAAGDGRFLLGLGASKIFMKEIGEGEKGKDVGPATVMRESIEIIEAMLKGDAVDYHGKAFDASAPALVSTARPPRACAHLCRRYRTCVAEAGRLSFGRAADGQHYYSGFRPLFSRQHGRGRWKGRQDPVSLIPRHRRQHQRDRKALCVEGA